MSTPPVNSCNSSAGLVEKYINSAYDNVKAVADNLDYLDQIYQFLLQYGLITNIAVKAPVQAVATSPITLSGNQVITWSAHSGDYTLLATTGMRVLVLGQTNPVENGIYDVQNNAWIRSVDFDGPKDVVDGTLVFSSQGDVWQVDGPQYSLVPGTDPIIFKDIDLFAYEALKEAREKAQEAAASAAAALASEQAAKVSEDNAASSKTHASNSAAAAAISETNAKVSESAAKVSENNAKASQIAAQNSASLAESVTNNSLTFATTAAGIAGTTNGQYFRVPQGSGATLSFIYYLNSSGTAQVVAEMPGKGAITNNIRSYSSLAVAQADVAAGNILNGAYCYVRSIADSPLADEYMNVSGILQLTGRKMPSQQTVDNVDAAIRKLITEYGDSILFLFSDLDGFELADISLDQTTGKTFLGVGGQEIKRSLSSVLEVTDRDGFVISLDDAFSRIRSLEKGTFALTGQSLERGPDLLDIVDKDGFSFSMDQLIQRVDTLENKEAPEVDTSPVADMENYAQAAREAMSYPVSAPVAVLRKGLNIFLFYGQSLAIGDEAFTVVTRQPSQLGNLMLGQAVRGSYFNRTQDAIFGVVGGENVYHPLEEKRQSGSGVIITDPSVSAKLGETVASGFCETLKTLHNRSKGVANDTETVIACSITGAVGTALSTLLKGASTPYYERLMSCLRGHMEAAALAGYTEVQVAGLVFLQGENDYGGTTRESYLSMLNQLINDFNADAKALTGQKDNVGFYLYQTGGVYTSQSQGNTLPVAMAQLDITSRADSFMVAPAFPYPQAASARTHMAANSYRWWGCMAANAVYRILNDENHSPFRMVKAVYDGKSIYVAFMVPCPPLTIKPYYQVANPIIKTDLGFTVIDSTGNIAGSSLQIEFVSPCVVRITPSRALTGSIRINLGDQIHGGGHNIADSSPQQSIFSWKYYGDNNQSANENIPDLNDKPYQMYNFSAVQTINVEVK